MVDGPAVTLWLRSLHNGDAEAAERLWTQYFDQLVAVAKERIGRRNRQIADEEDIALSVLNTLIRGAAEGRFQQLQDRRELWCLLLAITKRKVISRHRRESAQRRGAGTVGGNAMLGRKPRSGDEMTFDDLCGDSPTPDFVAELEDQHRFLMGLLPDETLRQIAQRIMEGYSTPEIASALSVTRRTVQRKVLLIRRVWLKALEPNNATA